MRNRRTAESEGRAFRVPEAPKSGQNAAGSPRATLFRTTRTGSTGWSGSSSGTDEEHVLAVDYEKDRPFSAPADSAPSGPVRAVYYHAVAVPTSGMPVRFAGTPVAAQNPWN